MTHEKDKIKGLVSNFLVVCLIYYIISEDCQRYRYLILQNAVVSLNSTAIINIYFELQIDNDNKIVKWRVSYTSFSAS